MACPRSYRGCREQPCARAKRREATLRKLNNLQALGKRSGPPVFLDQAGPLFWVAVVVICPRSFSFGPLSRGCTGGGLFCATGESPRDVSRAQTGSALFPGLCDRELLLSRSLGCLRRHARGLGRWLVIPLVSSKESPANHPIVLRAAWLSRRFTAHLASPPSRVAYSLGDGRPPSPAVTRMSENVAPPVEERATAANA